MLILSVVNIKKSEKFLTLFGNIKYSNIQSYLKFLKKIQTILKKEDEFNSEHLMKISSNVKLNLDTNNQQNK